MASSPPSLMLSGPEGLDALTQFDPRQTQFAHSRLNDGPDRSRYKSTYSRTDPDRRCQRRSGRVRRGGRADRIRAERRAIEIAARMLKAGRLAEALKWLDRWDGRGLDGEQSAVDIRIAALTALDRQDDAQAVRWDWVVRKLSLEHFRDYVRHLSTETAHAATVRATETAVQHEDVLAALQFLVGVGATAVAEQIILKRLPEIDGRWYHHLRPIAKQLTADQPLSAVLLYRAMAETVLKEARSKHYPYAAKDVLSAGQAAEAVTDWNDHRNHAAFISPASAAAWAEVRVLAVDGGKTPALVASLMICSYSGVATTIVITILSIASHPMGYTLSGHTGAPRGAGVATLTPGPGPFPLLRLDHQSSLYGTGRRQTWRSMSRTGSLVAASRCRCRSARILLALHLMNQGIAIRWSFGLLGSRASR